MSIVVSPDVELWATGWLRAALAARSEPYAAASFVGTMVPNPRPARFVTLRRDGGGRLDVVRESARLAVNCWAATEQDATNLARLTAGLLLSAADGNPVVHVDMLSGPSPIADEQPRRYLLFELIVRGTQS